MRSYGVHTHLKRKKCIFFLRCHRKPAKNSLYSGLFIHRLVSPIPRKNVPFTLPRVPAVCQQLLELEMRAKAVRGRCQTTRKRNETKSTRAQRTRAQWFCTNDSFPSASFIRVKFACALRAGNRGTARGQRGFSTRDQTNRLRNERSPHAPGERKRATNSEWFPYDRIKINEYRLAFDFQNVPFGFLVSHNVKSDNVFLTQRHF